MAEDLRILILEDYEPDVELVVIQIKKEGVDFKYKWVSNQKEFEKELIDYEPDIILSDYNMPSFTGLDALYVAKDMQRDIPFIIVTGSLNEQIAVDCMKKGAWDYVIKEQIVRVGPAIQNALKLRNEKLKKRQAQADLIKREQLYRLIAENSSDMISKHNLEGVFEFVSPSCFSLLGYEPEEILGRNIYDFFHPDDLSSIKTIHSRILDEPGPILTEYRLKNANGDYLWMEVSSSAFVNNEDEFSGEVLSITRNIQKRKMEELMREAVYNIGQTVVRSLSMEELFTNINTELKKLFTDSSINLSLYSEEKHVLDFPSENLQPSSPDEAVCIGSLMEHIISNDVSGIFTQDQFGDQGIINMSNELQHNCKSCMGTPLVAESKNIGVIIIKNAHRKDAFSDKDLELLKFTSTQIGLSIQGLINQEKLVLAKNRAEESDQLKSAFLANMSHEIRTPMNAILGFTELMSEHKTLDDDQREFLARIKDGGNLLIKLINDIIDLSKIEAGQLKIDIHTFSVSKLLEDLHQSFQEVKKGMNKAHLVLDLVPVEEDYFIQSDSLRLKQVLTNFLSNAIKYTRKGNITFGVRKTENRTIRFFVKDTGIGIPPDKLSSIFERFNKIDQHTDLLSSGTGLGLAICKSLAEYLEGSIHVESELDAGSEFSIELPFIQNMSIEYTPQEEVGLLTSDFKDKTFLIVEDDESSYFYLASALKKTRASLIWAMDGNHAVDICKKNEDIDLVLMDIRLPKLSGYVATETIKKIRPRLPIIAQTAYAMSSERQKCLEAGCDDYLSKPVKPASLLKLINKYISNNGKEE